MHGQMTFFSRASESNWREGGDMVQLGRLTMNQPGIPRRVHAEKEGLWDIHWVN